MAHAFRLNGQLHDLWLSRTVHGYELHCGDERIAVSLRSRGQHVHELVVGDETVPVYLALRGDDVHVHVLGEAHTLTYTHSLERFAAQAHERSEAVARAPMPGAVIALHVGPGQSVRRGDVMLVIESMKMETAISAGVDGVVKDVHVQAGQTFDRDALLVTLEPEENPSGGTA